MSIEQYRPQEVAALTPVTQDVAITRLGDWARSADAAHHVAATLVQTSFCPDQFRNKPGEATAAILAGLEVGLQPMAALRAFDIIQGSAAPKAITLRAVVQSHGHEMELVESTATRCRMRGRRRGSADWQTVTWTFDRAKDLGVTNKPNWRNQPQTMLVARATSELARLIASDAILGIGYSAEELADGGPEAAPTSTDEAPQGTRRMSRRSPSTTVTTLPGVEAAQDEELPVAPLEEPQEPTPLNTSSALAKRMFATFNETGITEREDRLKYVSDVVGREVASSSDMTEADASAVLDALAADLEGNFGGAS